MLLKFSHSGNSKIELLAGAIRINGLEQMLATGFGASRSGPYMQGAMLPATTE